MKFLKYLMLVLVFVALLACGGGGSGVSSIASFKQKAVFTGHTGTVWAVGGLAGIRRNCSRGENFNCMKRQLHEVL